MVDRLKETMLMHHIYKNHVTGTQSPRFYEVLDSDRLNADKNYVAHESNIGFKTLFSEVQLMPWEKVLSPKWGELSKIRARSVPMTINEFIIAFINTVTNYIEDTWEKDKFHIVTHSGGWDSRILSVILRDIHNRRGASFIGNIFFACFGQECKYQKKIMDIEGWNSNQYGSFPYDEAFFTHQLNFKKAWYNFNGPNSYPLNWRFWITDKLGVKPEDTDYYAAGYFNEVFQMIGRGRNNQLRNFINKYYYTFSVRTSSAYPISNIIQPIINPQTLELFIKSKVAYPPNTRHSVLKKLNPKLSSIDRLSNPPRWPTIPPKNISQAKKDYFGSFYGTKIKPAINVEPELAHSNWWSHWSTASLIEHLLEEGCEIKWH